MLIENFITKLGFFIFIILSDLSDLNIEGIKSISKIQNDKIKSNISYVIIETVAKQLIIYCILELDNFYSVII